MSRSHQGRTARDRTARRQIRRLERVIDELLDEHGTTLRGENGIGPIAAATLSCGVGNSTRFATESKFARWCGTGAAALSSAEGDRRLGECVASFDNLQPIRRPFLTHRAGELQIEELDEICRALRALADC